MLTKEVWNHGDSSFIWSIPGWRIDQTNGKDADSFISNQIEIFVCSYCI